MALTQLHTLAFPCSLPAPPGRTFLPVLGHTVLQPYICTHVVLLLECHFLSSASLTWMVVSKMLQNLESMLKEGQRRQNWGHHLFGCFLLSKLLAAKLEFYQWASTSILQWHGEAVPINHSLESPVLPSGLWNDRQYSIVIRKAGFRARDKYLTASHLATPSCMTVSEAPHHKTRIMKLSIKCHKACKVFGIVPNVYQ